MRPLLTRMGVGLLAVFSLALTTARLASTLAVVVTTGMSPLRLYYALMSVAAVTASVLAISLVRSAWSASGVPLLAAFSAMCAVASSYEGSAAAWLRDLPLPFPALWRAELLLFNALVIVATALAVLWLQRYPERVVAADIPHDREAGPVRRAFSAGLRWLLPARRVWIAFGLVPFVVSGAATFGLPIDPTVTRLVTGVLAAIAGLGYLRTHRAHPDPPRLRRAEWVVEAVVLALVLSGFALVFEVQLHILGRQSAIVAWPHAILLPLAIVSFIVSLATSVFYRGAVDPALVISKTTIVGAIGLALTCFFLVAEELIGMAVSSWLGLPDVAGSLLAGVAAAIAFNPLYRWTDRTWRRNPTSSA